jgi:hypothetical protein
MTNTTISIAKTTMPIIDNWGMAVWRSTNHSPVAPMMMPQKAMNDMSISLDKALRWMHKSPGQ